MGKRSGAGTENNNGHDESDDVNGGDENGNLLSPKSAENLGLKLVNLILEDNSPSVKELENRLKSAKLTNGDATTATNVPASTTKTTTEDAGSATAESVTNQIQPQQQHNHSPSPATNNTNNINNKNNVSNSSSKNELSSNNNNNNNNNNNINDEENENQSS